MSDPGDLASSVPSPGGGTVRATTRGSDFAELCRLIRREGLLDRRAGYYAVKIAGLVVLLAVGWAAFFAIGDSWWQLAVAVYLSVIFGQVGFVAHEAGHRQIFRSRRANDIVGLGGGNLLIGLSYGWWISKHNRHHSHPNQLGKDPDISIAVIAFTPEQARERRGLLPAPARYQPHHLFPAMPRPCLRRCRTLVRAFCTQTGVFYSEKGLLGSYGDVLRTLHAAGR